LLPARFCFRNLYFIEHGGLLKIDIFYSFQLLVENRLFFNIFILRKQLIKFPTHPFSSSGLSLPASAAQPCRFTPAKIKTPPPKPVSGVVIEERFSLFLPSDNIPFRIHLLAQNF
jgi:hypothetical protein